MGNLNVLYNLSKMNSEEKDKYLNGYIAVAPVYLGAFKAFNSFISGLKDLYSMNGKIGFHYKAA